jgi:glycosyltransferase involved in cell wall biosynthesis
MEADLHHDGKQIAAFVLPSFAGGGAEKAMLQVAAHIDRTRFTPIVIVLNGSGPLFKFLPEDVPIYDLEKPRLRQAIGKLRQALGRINPEVVLSTIGYLNMGVLAAAFGVVSRNCRLIVREANIPQATVEALGSRLLARAGYAYLYRRAAVVLCNAKAVRNALQHYGVPVDRIAVIPNPIDVEGLRRSIVPRAEAQAHRSHFVASGRLVHQKGFDRLLGWFSKLNPSAQLTIFGEGPMRAELEAQSRELGLSKRVVFKGYDSEPWQCIANANAFLLPSRWDGMSNAALEALALGTPVIGCREAGGIVELPDETPAGAVTITQRGDEFIAAMKSAAETRRENEIASSLLPDRFDLPNVMNEYEAICAGQFSPSAV